MSEDDQREFERQLDRLLSAHADSTCGLALAEILCATANGLLELQSPQPKYDLESNVVELPFEEPEHLEASLEDLLTRRAICLEVDAPLMQDVTLRVIAATESVDVEARTVQRTPAGVVIQITATDVETQRGLITLPASLRSQPAPQRRIDRQSVRIPNFTCAEEARAALQRSDAVAPAVELAGEPGRRKEGEEVERPDELGESEQPSDSSQQEAGDRTAEPGPTEPRRARGFDHRPETSRESIRESKIKAALKRCASTSLFEVLGIHFSADDAEVERAAAELLSTLEPLDSDGPELVSRIGATRERVDEAIATLREQTTRRGHRADVVDQFQIEAAVQMYERQAEAAKMRRKVEVAIEAYRRIVELQPGHAEARAQIPLLKRLLE